LEGLVKGATEKKQQQQAARKNNGSIWGKNVA
jgi:hypothetical protein